MILQLIIEIVLLVILCVILVYSVFITIAMVFGPPFVPSRKSRIREMISLADIRPGEQAVDLGSGDGRIVIALAQKGASVTGYEINPVLVVISRLAIFRYGLSKQTHVYWKNFWNEDLSGFDVVTVYALPSVMERLEKKLFAELKGKSRIVSNSFVFPTRKFRKRMGDSYLYVK